MDETPLSNDMVSNTTVEVTGSKEVSMESTGHDKVCVTVYLTDLSKAENADGTKCKPFILFNGAKRESKPLFVQCSVELWPSG